MSAVLLGIGPVRTSANDDVSVLRLDRFPRHIELKLGTFCPKDKRVLERPSETAALLAELFDAELRRVDLPIVEIHAFTGTCKTGRVIGGRALTKEEHVA